MGFSRQEYWSGVPSPSKDHFTFSYLEPRLPNIEESSGNVEIFFFSLFFPEEGKCLIIKMKPYQIQRKG